MSGFVAHPDPRLLYTVDMDAVRDPEEELNFTANSLGCRGPEPAKPGPGGRRLLVLGGSNVWGANVTDAQAWPARLQVKLSGRTGGPVAVLNCGVSGYNAIQMCANLERVAPRAKPDLIVFAPSNLGPRMFYPEGPRMASYFEKDPTLWWDFIPPRHLGDAASRGRQVRTWLLGHLALYRLGLATLLARELNSSPLRPGGAPRDAPHYLPFAAPHYVETVRRCLTRARELAPVVIFIVPGVQEAFSSYTRGLNLPTLRLAGEQLPAAQRNLHPPAHVLDWTADRLADWLVREGHLQGRTGPARVNPAACPR